MNVRMEVAKGYLEHPILEFMPPSKVMSEVIPVSAVTAIIRDGGG